MGNFAVLSDSACDLSESTVKGFEIDIVQFKVSFAKGKKLTEGVNITKDEFYRRLAESSALPKTYYPTVEDYVTHFKQYLEQGRDVLCLCLSQKLSKSYASAINAQKILSYNYPKNKIMVMDTMMASAGQGLLVLDAAKLRESCAVEAAYEKLENLKKTACSIVTVASLEQLARGGRMSSTSATLGRLLNINPIIYMENGSLISKHKAIGRVRALAMIKQLTLKEMGGKPQDYDFAMLHSRALREANAMGNDLAATCSITQTVPPIELGATIGMHTGASVVATAFAKKL